MKDDFISASAISEYLYCQRAWWYRLRGIVSTQVERMEQGTAAHQELAEDVQQVESQSQTARRLVWIGLALFIVFLIARGLAG